MLKTFLTTSGRLFFSMFAAVFIYAVGATVFIKSLTQDNEFSLRISNEAKAQSTAVYERQNKVEIDIIKSVEGFKSALVELKTEVKLLKEEVRRER